MLGLCSKDRCRRMCRQRLQQVLLIIYDRFMAPPSLQNYSVVVNEPLTLWTSRWTLTYPMPITAWNEQLYYSLSTVSTTTDKWERVFLYSTYTIDRSVCRQSGHQADDWKCVFWSITKRRPPLCLPQHRNQARKRWCQRSPYKTRGPLFEWRMDSQLDQGRLSRTFRECQLI